MCEQYTDPLRPKPSTDPLDDPPSYDMNAYLELAKDFDMTEEEKIELLTLLWDIMRRFVELGFGLDSVSLLGGQDAENLKKSNDFMIDSNNHQETE